MKFMTLSDILYIVDIIIIIIITSGKFLIPVLAADPSMESE